MKRGFRRISLLLLICSITAVLSAQELDHLYLKDGTLIRGTIKEIDPHESVKILDGCGNLWHYPMSDVERITREPFEWHGMPGAGPEPFRPGIVNFTTFGVLAGSASNERVAPFSLQSVTGWRNQRRIFTGAGAGLEFLTATYMPLFLDLRYDLFEGTVVPYGMLKGGYAVPLSPDREIHDTEYTYSGGLLAGAGIGLKIRSRNNFAWDISVSYRYQSTSHTETYEWNGWEDTYTDIYHRAELRLGFYID